MRAVVCWPLTFRLADYADCLAGFVTPGPGF
jgi:hypothetical protein